MSSKSNSKQVLDLYKSIRRLHRRLPPAFKELGNKSVMHEFNAHKSAKPQHIPAFIESWTKYRDDLREQMESLETLSSHKFGKNLDETDLNALNDDQIRMKSLYKL